MIPLLLCAALCTQELKPKDQGWKDLDGIIFIANEDIVTQSEYMKKLTELNRRKPFASQDDRLKAERAIQEEIRKAFTGSQAGQTMGLDKPTIDRYVRDWERRVIENAGGVDQFAEQLAHDNQTADDKRKEWRELVYRQLWEDFKTGRGSGGKPRVSVDRFVRPGYLQLEYDQLVDRPREVDLLGGTPAKVVLQILEVDAARVGGTPQAEVAAKQIRARLAAGGEFKTEVDNFGTAASRSEPGEPLDEASLAEVDPALYQLVAAASVGQLLPPVPPAGPQSKQSTHWRIVRVVKRIPAQIPAFRTREIQDRLQFMIEVQTDQIRLERARGEQRAGSYLWFSSQGG